MSRRGTTRLDRRDTGGVARFTPSSLSETVGWWNSRNVTIATGVSVVTNFIAGDTNKDFIQGTAGSQPTYTASDADFNGLPSLDSGLAARFMTARGVWAAAIPQPLTLFVVARESNAAAGNRSLHDCPGTSDRLIVNSNGATGIPQALLASAVSGGTGWQAAARIVAIEFNNASTRVYVNSKTTFASGTIGSANTLNRMALFGRTTAEFRGKWAETVLLAGGVGAGTLTQAKFDQVADYLAALYGITLT